MSKTVAPLLSFSASGQIAKTQVYSTWKGQPYARRYVVPANPNTAGQQETRNTFKWLNAVMRIMPADVLAGWQAYADVQRYTARNGWISRNLSGLRSQADLANLIMSPAVRSGSPASAMVLTPGDTTINVVLTAPEIPAAWTGVSMAVAACIRDQDPQDDAYYTVTADTDDTDPYSIDLDGLTNDVLYYVGGWFVFDRGDGTYAYGEAVMDSTTPTAT